MARPPGLVRAARQGSPSRFAIVAAAAAGSIIAVSIAAYPALEEGWRHAARYTARFSFMIFLVVFVARPWHRIWPGRATRWTVLHRRALGLAFATAHFIHLYALTRFGLESARVPTLSVLIGGAVAYVLLAAMVATSNDASVRLLGMRNWTRLHTVGIYWIWFVFLKTYVLRVAAGHLFLVPFALAAVAAMALRLAAGVRRRSRAELGLTWGRA